MAYYKDGRLDLGEIVREQLFLTLPMKRLCREELPGAVPDLRHEPQRGSLRLPASRGARRSALSTRSRKLFDK